MGVNLMLHSAFCHGRTGCPSLHQVCTPPCFHHESSDARGTIRRQGINITFEDSCTRDGRWYLSLTLRACPFQPSCTFTNDMLLAPPEPEGQSPTEEKTNLDSLLCTV